MKKEMPTSFADSICDIHIRKLKSTFFNHVNTLIDWKPVRRLIDKYDSGLENTKGQHLHDGLLLLKMVAAKLLWSERRPYQRQLFFWAFLRAGNGVSGSPTTVKLSRFGTAMTKNSVFEKLFKEINRQLEKVGTIVKTDILQIPV